MDIYAEIDQRRTERQARRQARIEREERIQRLVYPVRRTFEYIVAGVTIYASLWLLAFWASC